MFFKSLRPLLLVAMWGAAVPSAAETLPVAGNYAAPTDAAISVQTIAVENFGGDKGAALSFALSDRLDSVSIEGKPFFQIFPTAGDDVDAVLRGSANVEVVETALDDRKVTKCKERDKDKKCIREKVTYYDCARIDVSLYPRIRLIARDGTELYSQRDSLESTKSYCENDYSTPTANQMLEELVQSFAARTRYDLAPVYRDEAIRIMESRKGMSRADKKAFRAAVRATKRDVTAACDGFMALENTNSHHASVLFNIGLCHESRGELDSAADYYKRALAVEPGKDYPTSGLQRIESRRLAERQIADHFGN